MCGEDGNATSNIEKPDIKVLRKNYAMKFIRDHYLKEVCEYLKYDYLCLGYPFPKECVEAMKE